MKSNDKQGMSFLYSTFVKEMLTLSFRVTNNLSDAEDVVQESFVKSFQKIEQLKDPENYKYWLKRIVVNHSIRVSKKRIHFAQVEEGQIKAEEETENWYTDIKLEMINQAIQNLPNGCRGILTLYLLEGFKHREIAELYKIAESTSKSQYRYGLKLLKQELSKHLIH